MRFLVSVAWRNLWRHKRRSLITSTAMAVGVALCMAMVAYQDGMWAELFRVMVEQNLGHVQVHHPEFPPTRRLDDTLHDADALLAKIDAVEGTHAAAGRLQAFALVGTEKKSSGAMLVGVEPARERAVTQVEERVIAGRFLADAPAGEVVLGQKFAEDIGVAVGDEVVAVTQSSDGSLGNALYTVVGITRTGNAQMDRAGAWLHLDEAQDLMVLPDQLHQVTVLADDPSDLDPFAASVRAAVGTETVQVQTWSEASPQTAQLMGMRDFATFIVLGIVFGAAAFGVLNTMIMSVFERTRELGVLKALGLRPARLVALIVVESMFLAGLSLAIGLVLGGLLDAYVVIYGFDMSSAVEDGFSFAGVMIDPVIKGQVSVKSIAQIVGAVFLVSVGASLWPAMRAARLRPVESIRSE